MTDINIYGETRNVKEVQFQTTGNETVKDIICIHMYMYVDFQTYCENV
jgi:hypothetical protein